MRYLSIRARDISVLDEFVIKASTYNAVREWMLEHYSLSQWSAIHQVLSDLKLVLQTAPDGTELVNLAYHTHRVDGQSRTLMLRELDELLAVIENRILQLRSA